MAMTIINGSNLAGLNFDERVSDRNIVKVIRSIQTMNNEATYKKIKGIDFLSQYMVNVEGLNGHTEAFKSNTAYFSDDGDFQDSTPSQERFDTWSYSRKGYTIKAADFTNKLLETAYESGKSLESIISERINTAMNSYIARYLPNVAYETLFKIRKGGSYYDEPRGFLYDVEVENMLKPGVDPTIKRNHYKAIMSPTVGPQYDDLFAMMEYLNEYEDIMESNIIMVGSLRSGWQLKKSIKADENVDKFAQKLEPSYLFGGVKFFINDFMPSDVIMFLDDDSNDLIKRLISPKPDRRGIALVKETGFEKLESIHDITNSVFKILPEGYHLNGRHKGLFMDLAPIRKWEEIEAKVKADINNPLYIPLALSLGEEKLTFALADKLFTDQASTAETAKIREAYAGLRLMEESGINKLRNWEKLLHGFWYRNMR